MELSSWYLDSHVRETRERAMREAEQARQVDAAARSGAQSDGMKRQAGPWRAISAMLAWLAPRGSRPEHAGAARMDAARQSARPYTSARQPRPRRPIRAAEPYAGMVVIARGPVVSKSERACPVATC
jgi:hypothetical protein